MIKLTTWYRQTKTDIGSFLTESKLLREIETIMGLKDFLFNNDYSFLLHIAIILLSTKLLGLLTKRISLPQGVGALAAGIILGPMLLDVVERNDLIVSLAELGVIVLMFSAGLVTDCE